MPRARNIKPSFFCNEQLADLSLQTRLAFVGLWCLADREGRLEDRPRKIRAELFPYESSVDMDDLLNELAACQDSSRRPSFIVRYETPEGRFIQVVNFSKHQTPHVKEKASTIPAPDKPSASTRQAPDKHPLIPDSLNLIPDCGILNADDPESGILKEDRGNSESLNADREEKQEDPLENYSILQKHYKKICELLKEAHPRTREIKHGSPLDFKSRDCLAKLVRLDKFSEKEIVDCLMWLFGSGHRDAEFWCGRGGVKSLTGLRLNGKDDVLKFVKVHAAWETAGSEVWEDPREGLKKMGLL